MMDERLNDLARAINAEPDKLSMEELRIWSDWWGAGSKGLKPAVASLLTKILDWHHEEVVHEVKEEILSQARYQP